MQEKHPKKSTSKLQRLTAIVMAGSMVVQSLTLVPTVVQGAQQQDYEIYPSPQSINYADGDYILKNDVNIVYESGIDAATRSRLTEVLQLKQDITSVTESDAVVEGKTNILVGIEGSEEYVDNFAKENVTISTDGLYNKTDSYVLESDNDVITVLGKDTDSSYYALTTLYHIVKQMDSYTIRNFQVEDWADVSSRGFIEGYYGNPWSTQDRMNLMSWGGYYKLNSYFYAPKDDPKHNANWRDLYTPEEIETKIKPLAAAGNASKCRFVFALHPFMNNPISFESQEAYEADLKVMQAKFEQVIEAGVRQIAILADDAKNYNDTGNLGGNNYKRVLQDMTTWLTEKQKQYPDLKITLPFCPVEYGGNGESYYRDFPDNVQIVMTGGRVWGEVSNNFTNTFTTNVGRGPYMWINWPCTDNSKKHLIMGGYDTFLQSGVNPANIQGIVLNPMQQSEPSKVAIFGNACYSWNIWENAKQANAAWDASFKYVDHNSAVPTQASNALREISKHMINQAMDSRVTALEESVELAPLLNTFKEKLAAGTLQPAEVDPMIEQFQLLQNSAALYQEQAGDVNLKNQMVHWLNCWKDTTDAAIAYLNGVKAVLNGETANIIQYSMDGKAAFERSKSYGFHYVDHQEYAEVGVQHIVPFINTLADYMAKYSELEMNPSAVITQFTSNRTDTPVNGTDKALDGNDSTFVSYQNPVWIKAGDYVGVTYNKSIQIDNIRFLLGDGKNHFEQSKLEYTKDGTTWEPLPLQNMQNSFTATQGEFLEIKVPKENLPENFQAMGIRLTATQDNVKDAYLDVYEIQVNKPMEQTPQDRHIGTITYDGMSEKGGSVDAYFDGSKTSEVHLAKGPYQDPERDAVPANATLTITFDAPKAVGSFTLLQGQTAERDVFKMATVEYQLDGSQQWIPIGIIGSGKEQTIDFNNLENVKAIRLVNKQKTDGWVRVAEIDIRAPKGGDTQNLYTNVQTDMLSLDRGGNMTLTPGTATLNTNDYIGVQFDNIKEISSISTSQLPQGVVLQTSMNQITWTDYNPTSKATVDAAYVRIINTGNQAQTVKLDHFAVGYKYTGKKSVESSFALADPAGDMRLAGTVDNLFDGNLSTFGMINGAQEQGKEIIIDLGQVVHFSSLRYYIAEAQRNYLRDADFSVSTDKATWTPVLHVGQATENTPNESTAKDMQDITLYHDSQNPGYMFKEATGLNVDGRYLKITPTSTYSHRWVVINELQINGGAYVSHEDNKDFITDSVEQAGKIPSNMLDGNYNSVYKPSEKNGSFTYRLKDPQNAASIRLVQLGNVSDAVVTARFIGENKDVLLGTLNQAINEFLIPDGKTLESVKVEWTDKIPEIAEIAVSANKGDKVDKTALGEALKQQADPAWTTDSINTYNKTKEMAQQVYNNQNVSQAVVETALGALNSARQNAVAKATNLDELQNLLKGKISNSQNLYSNLSYTAYEDALNALEKGLKKAENLSQAEADTLKANVEAAVKGLAYSTRNREIAELKGESYQTIAKENYTTDSYTKLTAAKEAMDALIAKDKQGETTDGVRIHPQEFIDAEKAYQAAKNELVDISKLKALIAEFDTVDSKLYTEDSYAAYEKAVNDSKELLNNGSKTAVQEAVKAIETAKGKLVAKPDSSLSDMIAQAEALKAEDYTTDSHTALMKIVKEAKEHLGENDKQYVAAIQDAIHALVNVHALKGQIAAAEQVQADKFTTSSYKVVSDLLAKKETLLKSGSKAEVDAMTAQLETAIRQLEVRAVGVEEYRSQIKLQDANAYTAESYQAYKTAYDALMKADPKDLSVDAFAALKAAFEQAAYGLKPTDTPNQPDTKPTPQPTAQPNPQQPVTPSNGGQNNTKPVQTGDASNVLLSAMMAAGAGVLAWVTGKKRKHN